jgi:hypothetical protein
MFKFIILSGLSLLFMFLVGLGFKLIYWMVDRRVEKEWGVYAEDGFNTFGFNRFGMSRELVESEKELRSACTDLVE